MGVMATHVVCAYSGTPYATGTGRHVQTFTARITYGQIADLNVCVCCHLKQRPVDQVSCSLTPSNEQEPHICS